MLTLLAGLPAPFEKSGKWGYKAAGGRVVIEPRFTVAQEFSPEGIAAVVDERGWAYIDPQGRILVRPVVVDNGPDDFEEGLARFRDGGRVGFFDKNGKIAIPAKFAFALPFSEGLSAVCEGCREQPEGEHTVVTGGKWGFIDAHGAVAIPLQFEKAEKFERGRAKVKSAGKWKYIDKKGAEVAASIGEARMEQDGTVVLQLRAESADGAIGDALLRYPPNHPKYKSILQHLGGLRKGESKPVPPWPEK